MACSRLVGVPGARLHHPRQMAIQGGDRQRRLGQPHRRHVRQDIQIAQDQRRLGDDGDGMAEVAQHFQNGARDAHLLFQRLIRISVGAHGNHLGDIARCAQLLGQQRRRIGLGEQAAFEIHPRRHAEIGVGGPGEAIDAAMLAAAIGIDGLVEGNVRRFVARDDGAGGVMHHFGAQRRGRLIVRPPAIVPAVIDQDPRLLLIAPDGVGQRAAAPEEAPVGGDV